MKNDRRLNRSRSPLLLHDDYLPSDNSPLDPDFPATNTTSWMSDAARSDASHRLYREVDPSFSRQHRIAGMTDSSYHLAATPTSGDDEADSQMAEEEEVTGGWVAVTRLSSGGSHKRTTTSAIYLPSSSSMFPAPLPIRRPRPPGLAHPLQQNHGEEEMDSLELARVARGLWAGGPDRNRLACSSAAEGHRGPVIRPSVLNLGTRSFGPGLGRQLGPSYYRQSQPVLQQTLMALDPSVVSGDDDSPMELDWDHEPGIASAAGPPGSRSGARKNRVYLSGSYLSSTLDGADVSDSENGTAAFVHRRPPIRLDATGSISGLPYKAQQAARQYHRLSTGDSVDAGAGVETAHLPDELVDSGFVGLMNSSSCGGGGGGPGDSDVSPELVAG